MNAHQWRAGDVPAIESSVCDAILDGEDVLYNPVTARSLLLNSSLTEIWAAVEGGRSVAGLCELLADRYGVSPDALRRDVTSGLATLEDEGFLRRG